MKKRLLAFSLVVIMTILSVSTVFAAKQKGTSKISWADVKDLVQSSEDLQGRFVELEGLSVKIYIPYSFEDISVGDDGDFIASYALKDGEFIFAVSLYDGEGMGIEGYIEFLKNKIGVTSIDYVEINGYEAISYSSEDGSDIGFISYETGDGNILEFAFIPVGEEEYQPYLAVLMASIMGSDDPER